MIKNKKEDGFIALISAIIISFVLIGITLSVGTIGLYSRFNILDAESKERSLGLAEACGDTAILEVSFGTYSVNEIISVGPTIYDNCTIIKSVKDPSATAQTYIKTQAVINKAFTNVFMVIDKNYNITDWQECTNFTSSDIAC